MTLYEAHQQGVRRVRKSFWKPGMHVTLYSAPDGSLSGYGVLTDPSSVVHVTQHQVRGDIARDWEVAP